MNNADIISDFLKKLIQDLGLIFSNVQKDCKEIKNAFIFNHLEEFIKKLQPVRIDNINYSRNNIEADLKKLVDENLEIARKYSLEINSEDTHNLISVIGDLYAMAHKRAEVELSSLRLNLSKHNSSEELMKSEFNNSKAFDSKEEHQKWLADAVEKLSLISSQINNVSQNITNQMTGLWWNIKLKAAKFFHGFDIPSLTEDISIINEAIINNYQKYENSLIDRRYS